MQFYSLPMVTYRFIIAHLVKPSYLYLLRPIQDSRLDQQQSQDIPLVRVSYNRISYNHITVPSVTVPLGFQPDNITATPARPTISNAPGVPFGLSFMGTAFSEFQLIGFAFAYEQATHTRLKRLAFAEAIPKTQLKDVVGK